jgi:hypothetical protein
MFNRYIEAREMRQFRKAQDTLQKRRQLFILVGIMAILLGAIAAVQAAMPAEPAKSATAVPTTTNPQELQDIREFAFVVTKPLATLTQKDLDLITRKENDPCYKANVGIGLDQDHIVIAISACKSLK